MKNDRFEQLLKRGKKGKYIYRKFAAKVSKNESLCTKFADFLKNKDK